MAGSWAAYASAWDRAPILLGTGVTAAAVGGLLAAGGIMVAVLGTGSSTQIAIGPGSLRLGGSF
jgi:hypothetical protein